jgi:two-component sensor histidine kinase
VKLGSYREVFGDTLTASEYWTGGGEMDARMRAYDWNNSVLGPPENWPQSLRIIVRLILNSAQPMLIWWGPELIQFYNDAYIPLMEKERHPQALAGRGRDFCADSWDIVGPQIDYVLAGKGSIWERDRLMPVTRDGRREDAWWSYSYGPIDDEGRVGGVLVICNEVTAQHLASEALKDQTRHLTQLFEQAPGYMAVLRGPDHIFEITNAAYKRLIGDRAFMGKPVREVIPEIVSQGRLGILDETYRTGRPYVGRRVPLMLRSEPGEPMKEAFVDFVYQPIMSVGGEVSGIFVAGVDVTDHVHAEQHLHLMNTELGHRVRNTLSIVGAIASQTLRDHCNGVAFEAFQNRLAALGRAHQLLTATSRPAASVRDVVEHALAPHRTGAGRIAVSGPKIIVGSKQALSLGLAVHEMATNAIKYGALSNDSGRIAIAWSKTLDGGVPIFHFSWQEHGGPRVEKPQRKGLGSELVEGRLAWDFGAAVELSYEPSGFICRLTAPMGNLGWPSASPVS